MHVTAFLRRGDFVLDASFDAPQQGVVALFGRSGCGKTTLVNAIAGLLRPERGCIRIGESCWYDSARGIDLAAHRRAAGYVFQDARLFPHLDVGGNLRYGLRRARTRPRGVGFDDIVGVLALEPLLARAPAQLSGGERRRVALGRALLAQPDLLLMDEPFAGLDLPRRAEFIAYIDALRERLALPIVLVTHDFDDVLHLATHLVVMAEGRVVAQGAVTELGLHPALTDILGSAASGAILDATVSDLDPHTGLVRVQIGGSGVLKLRLPGTAAGSHVRLQLLARDLILARDEPRGLSVRNRLQGIVTRLDPGADDAIDVQVDLGGPKVVARITRDAVEDLQLVPGQALHVLVKAVSIRGHVMSGGI